MSEVNGSPEAVVTNSNENPGLKDRVHHFLTSSDPDSKYARAQVGLIAINMGFAGWAVASGVPAPAAIAGGLVVEGISAGSQHMHHKMDQDPKANKK